MKLLLYASGLQGFDIAADFVTFKNFAMSLPTRLVDEISSYVEPLEARRIEKELHQRVRNLLVAFVVAGVTDDGKK